MLNWKRVNKRRMAIWKEPSLMYSFPESSWSPLLFRRWHVVVSPCHLRSDDYDGHHLAVISALHDHNDRIINYRLSIRWVWMSWVSFTSWARTGMRLFQRWSGRGFWSWTCSMHSVTETKEERVPQTKSGSKTCEKTSKQKARVFHPKNLLLLLMLWWLRCWIMMMPSIVHTQDHSLDLRMTSLRRLLTLL